ncbi:fasciclin-1 isoform X4 [Hermetia illucens]|uniref:fasciclin-1 isoform X4 n=1 Tax=Hermetia illucens TaxID=343691 RepID=UPI0018CC367E|nr:fasciclin-1 isoform X4 [Hermetia illucens]
MKMIRRLLALWIVLIAANLKSFVEGNQSLLDKIRDDPDLSQFYAYLEVNEVAKSALQFRSVTLFVPTNQAFQRFMPNKTYVQYHMSTVATTLEQLGPTILSDLDGNPPLYVTKKRDQSGEHIYINDALILKSRSNIQTVNQNGKKQVMHVIDGILVPLTLNPSSSLDIYNPDAFQFLTHSDSLEIGPHRVRSYRQRVIMMKKEYVYQAVGGHTFLIPVEEGFKPSPRPDLIDRKVIDGHVIPNRVIFTTSAPLETPQTTLAFEDNIKVSVSFFSQKEGPNAPAKMYVKSNTILGDSKHSTGVVLAEIVKANIPVKNGVVHLIHRPLMVVDTTVTQFLKIYGDVIRGSESPSAKEKDDGPLYKFYEIIMDSGGQFMEIINNLTDVTILAPSNAAWMDSTVYNVIGNKTKMKEILNLHIIRDRLNIEKIRQRNQNAIAQVPTYADRKYLYFNIITNGDGNETVTVEGGGVNASIVQGDIAQTNGYIHIIDRVLGIPYTTVLGKLSTDPMMNATYLLGEAAGFNEQLNDTTKRFTYFVARDKAWKKTETEFPSTHKKLFMRDYVYHAKAILQRHLVISDHAYTMGELKHLTNDSMILPTVRDTLKIRVREDSNPDDFMNPDKLGYSILWNNRWISVYRPDVECINGIIHVIDHPFLEEKDVKVTSGTSDIQVAVNILFGNFFMILIAKLLL